LPGTDFFPRR
jgi:hypothetical protein